ncbi:DUF1206 domain-containing protein [Mycolicibacterium vaccae]|jgi:hypothetical protein|uniref:DUF1206 domain-containing protein n=1 Tax=Mycolicibacterium vaccae ATCC 25954 TaxID=1194972 RepID=K0UR31_MYCVA|nr:DUF1206 domain-containing protein [Mycolicibacterium vaccae]ANI39285.1 membrane protein [Mycolicibacterium vaccae 95051]EJZ05048.1 hypothetical protein MVAC_26606 [Mycolicibacterium vaccae ATCC 25954]MCV7062708.1 DUF1206 domain-containing protein [Mycolicibacterium vaccae]
MATRPSAASLHRSAHGAADRATDSNAFEYLARAGFAASGVLHLLVGFIIAKLAFVGGGGSADQSGALAELSSQTGGTIILWAAVAGLVALGLWRVAEAVIGAKPGESSGREGDNPAWKRGKALALAVVNFAIAFSAARYAMGTGQSSSQQNAGLSAQLMQSGWGKALLIAVGIGVIAVGAYHVYKGVSEKFLDDLRVSGGTAVTAVGITGYVAKGLVLGGAGLLVVIATLQADPSKATGLDAAVKTLGSAPFGKALLIAAALGIAAFGAYSFVRSRYSRM